MIKFSLILFYSALLISCKNESSTVETSSVDSRTIPEISIEDNEKLMETLRSYTDMVMTPINIDTSFVLDGIQFNIQLAHNSLGDNGVNVPSKYVEMYGIANFITHNFNSTVWVRRGDEVILEIIIKKEDFRHLLDESLQQYGVLLYPNLDGNDSLIQINHSISIPLTDVGARVTTTIDKNGLVKHSLN